MALTKFNYNSFDVTTAASTGLAFNSSANGFDTAAPGAMTLIATNTISSGVSSSSFTSGIDSTYDTYIFKLINIHPATDGQNFRFQASTDGGSNYGVTCTSTAFRAYHFEDDSSTDFGYTTGNDLAQSTSYKQIFGTSGTDNDQGGCATIYIFSPSSTTFVKHFIMNTNTYTHDNRSLHKLHAGYFNTTSAIDAFDFKFDSGNIDSGVIKMYGITK